MVKDEFKRIQSDRDLLRSWTLKTYDDSVHLPVNIVRLIWNAKSQFSIKPDTVTSLSPNYIIKKTKDLIQNLTVVQGINNKLLEEANSNAKDLFSMQLRHLLCSKNILLVERLTQPAFDWLIAEIKTKFE